MTSTDWYGWGWLLIKASAVAALVVMDLGLLVALGNCWFAETQQTKEKKHERE